MHVRLEIKEDKELRNMIKDMVRGAVTSVIRENINDLIEKEVRRKVKGLSDYELQAALERKVRNVAVSKKVDAAVKKVVSFEFEQAVNLQVCEVLENMDTKIDEIIKEKMNGMSLTISK